MKHAVISRDPEIMGGTPVFSGTRVPVQTLLDYLEAGESSDEFLAGFPTVTRAQVIEFLEAAKDELAEPRVAEHCRHRATGADQPFG
jgi:uncharacterized protein (DUF433 family)